MDKTDWKIDQFFQFWIKLDQFKHFNLKKDQKSIDYNKKLVTFNQETDKID